MKNIFLFVFALFVAVAGKAQTYTTTTPITGLSYPVAFTFTPDGRYLVTEKGGIIKIFNPDGSSIGNFYNLTDSTFNDFERGLLGIEVDPDFANNHYVYAYYNHRYPNNSSGNTQQKLRVVRFTEVNNVGTNPTLILNITPGYSLAGNHVGGNLHFRPSEPGKLYITIGELAVSSNAQLLTNPYGKFLRINKDGSIPTDNPFYDDGNPATGNDDRIWTYGHRNPFDFCFSPVNDSLYSSENGQNTWDEMNIVTHGKNYGWNTCEGDYLIGSTTSPCTNANYTNPIETWASPLPAVTGIVHYTGCIMPELANHILVADNDYGRIYNITLGNAPAYDVVTSRVQILDLDGLTTLRQGADGYIYALNGGYAPAGKIYRIGPTNPATPPSANIILGIVPYEVCAGSPFTMMAASGSGNLTYEFTLTNGDNIYQVSTDSEQGVVSPQQPGVYDLILVTSNGCITDTDTVISYLTVFAPPTFTVNSTDAVQGGVNGTAWLSNVSNASVITWYDSNNNAISQNDSINNLTPGTYTVTVTNGGVTQPCSVTDTVTIQLLNGIPELTLQGLKIYPNPANDRLFVDLNSVKGKALNAQVYNSVGSLVMSPVVNAESIAGIDIASLPTGMYYIRIATANSIYSAKWTKQ